MLIMSGLQLALGIVVAVMTIASILLAWSARGRKERRAKRAFEQVFREDWLGADNRPGVPGRPGVMTQLYELTQGWEAVRERLRRAELEIKNLRSQHNVLFHRLAQVESDCPLSAHQTKLVSTDNDMIDHDVAINGAFARLPHPPGHPLADETHLLSKYEGEKP